MSAFVISRCAVALLLVFAMRAAGAWTASVESPTAFAPDAYKAAERHERVRILAFGNGRERSYVVMPDDPAARQLPLVIFLHGWRGVNPLNFGALIDHLARRGSVVIYPVYQRDAGDAPQGITQVAESSLRAVLDHLRREFPGVVALDKALYYGFSMGATMAINLAGTAPANGLPPASMLLLSAPGDAKHVHHGDLARSILMIDIRHLPLSLPVVLMTGSEDVHIGLPTAYEYWNRICAQSRKRALVVWPPGHRGGKTVRATHGMPGAPDPRYDMGDIDMPMSPRVLTAQRQFPASVSLNNLDFHGQWKVVVAALESLRGDRPPPNWLFADSPLMRDLGSFDDGAPYPQAHLETGCPASPSR